MAIDDASLRQLLRLLEARPEARAELRRLIGGDGTEQALRELTQAQARTEQHLSSLTERLDRLSAHVEQLTERVDQLAESMDQLAKRMDQLAVRVDQLAVRMDQLAEAQMRTEAALRQLATSVAGEREQRRGDRYERDIRLDALDLCAGGDGGAPLEEHVRARVRPMLAEVVASDRRIGEDANPMRADLIWWKDGHFLVAEASIVVGMHDVTRAAERAATVREAGKRHGVKTVLPVVFGRNWSGEDARLEAERLGVAWWMQEPVDISADFVAYRRLRGVLPEEQTDLRG